MEEEVIGSAEVPSDLSDKQTVCDVCLAQNLTQQIWHRSCNRCGITYCSHFASVVDAQFCLHCMKEIEITEETLVRTSTHVNEDTEKVYTRTQKARHIVFSGNDWLFMQRKINTMTDEEVGMYVEYHQAMYSGLLYEREKRRVEYFHRNAGKQYVPRISSTETEDSTVTTVKKTRKTKVITPEDAQVRMKAVLQAMLDAGMSPDKILSMMGGKK